MNVSAETIVMDACVELSGCKYANKSIIMCCIKAMKIVNGYQCDANDEEICEKIIETMHRINMMS